MENNENIALSEETAAPCGADTKRSFGNIVKHYADRYFIKALGAMAKGLFASLLIGTIIAQFARIPALSGILDPIVKVAQNGFVVGGAIGAAIAVGLGAKALTLCAAVVVGAIGYTSGAGGAGPVGAYIAAVISSRPKPPKRSTRCSTAIRPCTTATGWTLPATPPNTITPRRGTT